MKILNRKQFLKMPSNTLYTKYAPCWFGSLMVKFESGSSDWNYESLNDPVKCNSSEEMFKILEHSKTSGDSFDIEFGIQSRDGGFDEDQLFVVWEKADIRKLILVLQNCLVEE
jgi:hypothetical protein